MTATGPRQGSRGEHCEFQVLTAMPAGQFVEIGTIDVQQSGWGDGVFRTLDAFKDHIEPYVCRAGGDVAVAMANGYGMYIKATVLKTKASTAEAQVSPKEVPGGCQFDTQCKGDRLCVKGECVEPEKK
jgi:hypothetical protein